MRENKAIPTGIPALMRARQAKGLSRSDLAVKAGVDYDQIEAAELYRGALDEGARQRIAAVLGTPGLFAADGTSR